MPFRCEQQQGCALGGAMQMMRLARILVGILFCILIPNPVQASNFSLPTPYSLTLAWNPSPSSEIVACHLYYGTVSGEYTNIVVVGDVTTVTVPGLLPGVTYFFAITAVNVDGQESDFSNEISYRQELAQAPPTIAQLQIQSVSDTEVDLSATGPAGHTYEIEATEDFLTWTVIGTGTLDAGGSLNFTDIDAPNYSQRFYRLHDTQPASPPITVAQLQIQSVSDGQFLLTVTGPAGHTYDIEATEDFTTWTVIGMATLDASGSLDFTDTDAPNHSQRFYRLRDTQPAQQNGQTLPSAQVQIQAAPDGQFILTVTGPVGHTYDIEATEDFTSWTVIGTATGDDSGSLNFTDIDAPNYSQRFYRTREIQP
ncbi:MAG: fibronectin type III domain-containing protein [Verrucomicrobiota bacterium]